MKHQRKTCSNGTDEACCTLTSVKEGVGVLSSDLISSVAESFTSLTDCSFCTNSEPSVLEKLISLGVHTSSHGCFLLLPSLMLQHRVHSNSVLLRKALKWTFRPEKVSFKYQSRTISRSEVALGDVGEGALVFYLKDQSGLI